MLKVFLSLAVVAVAVPRAYAQQPVQSPVQPHPAQPPAQPAPPAAPRADSVQGTGIVVGRVTEKATSKPLPGVNVVIVGTRIGARTETDGRYRIVGAPAGPHSVRATALGNAPAQYDNIPIRTGDSITVNFALVPVSAQLTSVKVKSATPRAASESDLLALQKSAPRVSDGISAQALKRAPGSNASDAIVRVTGVSVFDRKFAVVRGLAERYSNTMLNGVELPSPEPLKKIVPLDLFPSSLLQAIVVSKTATPDRPGDFAGGSVEIDTKDFPDKQVADVNLSLGYNSRSTFHTAAQMPLHGVDWLGFDSGSRRQMPADVPTSPDSPNSERFAEELPNKWTPAPTRVAPDASAGLSLGGRTGGNNTFGYTSALTYNRKTDAIPDRFSQLLFDKITGVPNKGYIADEVTSRVDLGGLFNVSQQLGRANKISWKNLYTRNAEELLSRSTGFETYNGNREKLTYQARYITRILTQTQLSGDHRISRVLPSRLEWKATLAASSRDEPENRSLIYYKQPDGQYAQSASSFSPYWFRFLNDRIKSGQLDWNLPLGGFFPAGSRVKVGGLLRSRHRQFRVSYFQLGVTPGMDTSSALALPPDEATSGENIGPVIQITRTGEGALPYESNDDVKARYGMVDIPLTVNLRLVGGVRVEDWTLALYQGTKAAPVGTPTERRNHDNLFSGNLIWNLTDRQNVRLAAATTLARPDPRELSADYYVAVTGDCANQGNPDLQRSRIFNGDARWEFYPSGNEIVAVSGFYKRFDRPIVELLSYPGSSQCVISPHNIEQAHLYGVEFELRKGLTFLPGLLNRLSTGVNFTWVNSKAEFRPTPDLVEYLKFQGQSNGIGNLNLLYGDLDHGFEGSLLLNGFSDRIVRYGAAQLNGHTIDQIPHVMEKGRVSLDAKLQHRIRHGVVASLSGRNLTNTAITFYQESDVGAVRTAYLRPGAVYTFGLGYAIR